MQLKNYNGISKFILFLGTGFGIGLIPKAPGTFGTLPGILIYCLIMWLFPDRIVLWSITLAITLIGIWICHKSCAILNTHDDPRIVWDEIAGYLITMSFAPFTWEYILMGFVLFRFFDILKPFPIRLVDRKVEGGFGVMLDDVLAAFLAAALLHLIHIYIG